MFVQNWNTDKNDSTRSICYIVYADFRFQPFFDLININKFGVSLFRLRISAHSLNNKTGRWNKPKCVPSNERKCQTYKQY